MWFVAAIALVVAWGIGWGIFVDHRTKPYVDARVPVGQVWTDKHGTRFSVVDVETRPQIDSGYDTTVAPAGSVFVIVQMKYENWQEGSSCNFILAGEGQQRWSPESRLPGKGDAEKARYRYCLPDEMGPSAEFTNVFLVPKARLEGLEGMMIFYMQWRHNATLELPPLE